MFGGLGVPELLLILVILLMVFGAGKLPQVAEMLGSGVKKFRDSVKGKDSDEQKALENGDEEQ
jgi:sec-independent protein translocase protein TatA